MTAEEAIRLFEKRNNGLLKNPCCQSNYERVKRQRDEIERNELAIAALNRVNSSEYPTLSELWDMLEQLEDGCRQAGDGHEDYTNGFRWGHRNGQIELLRWVLKVRDGACENQCKERMM